MYLNGEICCNAHEILIKYHCLYADKVISTGGPTLLHFEI
jgi:hypothetical protein